MTSGPTSGGGDADALRRSQARTTYEALETVLATAEAADDPAQSAYKVKCVADRVRAQAGDLADSLRGADREREA